MIPRILNVIVLFIGLYMIFGFLPKGALTITPAIVSGLALIILTASNLLTLRDKDEYTKFKETIETTEQEVPQNGQYQQDTQVRYQQYTGIPRRRR